MRFEARETIPHWLPWMAVAGAGVGTLCFAAILIAAAGASPLVGFKELFIGAFGSRNAITETGATATPSFLPVWLLPSLSVQNSGTLARRDSSMPVLWR